jgi:anti-anti-sigma factor
MTVTNSGVDAVREVPFGPNPGHAIDCRGARLQIHARKGVAVLTMGGAINSSNADHVGATVNLFLSLGDPLVLDLSDVDVVTAAGVRTLFDIDRACERAEVQWSLVDNGVVRRTLDIAASSDTLPVAKSVGQALQRVTADPRSSRRMTLPIVAPEKLHC